MFVRGRNIGMSRAKKVCSHASALGGSLMGSSLPQMVHALPLRADFLAHGRPFSSWPEVRQVQVSAFLESLDTNCERLPFGVFAELVQFLLQLMPSLFCSLSAQNQGAHGRNGQCPSIIVSYFGSYFIIMHQLRGRLLKLTENKTGLVISSNMKNALPRKKRIGIEL